MRHYGEDLFTNMVVGLAIDYALRKWSMISCNS